MVGIPPERRNARAHERGDRDNAGGLGLRLCCSGDFF
jgi:hypothetical protein